MSAISSSLHGSTTEGSDVLFVNGLRLPGALVAALREGRWYRPPNARLHRVFRERPTGARLFDLATMHSFNLRWRAETDRAWFGHPDDRAPPGDIDRRSSVILGSLGPDLPFALDYRASPDAPRIVYLHSGGDRWITVAHSIEELLERLGLHRVRPAVQSRRASG